MMNRNFLNWLTLLCALLLITGVFAVVSCGDDDDDDDDDNDDQASTDPYEPNSEQKNAWGPIPADTPLSGIDGLAVAEQGDDWFYFEPPADQLVIVDLTGDSDGDLIDLCVWEDGNADWLVCDTMEVTDKSVEIMTGETPVKYYIDTYAVMIDEENPPSYETAYDLEWTSMVPDFCPGWTFNPDWWNYCCQNDDPCGYAGDDSCDCEGMCAWDAADCA